MLLESYVKVIDVLGLFFDMLSYSRHWQTSGRLVQELDVCTVACLGSKRGVKGVIKRLAIANELTLLMTPGRHDYCACAFNFQIPNEETCCCFKVSFHFRKKGKETLKLTCS